MGRFEAAERRLGLRRTVQLAMVLGRLYGGGAILIEGVGTFYPLNCGPGDIERRDRVRRRRAQVGALTGEFENGKFVLSDGRISPVAAMRIERSRYDGRGYAPDW